MVRIQVPATLQYRDVVLRAVSAACKLVGTGGESADRSSFRIHVVSAFGEAFNNIVIHGYAGGPAGTIDVELEIEDATLRISVRDFGAQFDLDSVPEPDLASLPEKGMGLFIIRSFMDEVSYHPGTPNLLVLTKRFQSRN